MRQSTDGVFCLANDAVVDGLIALCESIRQYDPDLPLTVIPFNDSIALTREVASAYNYDLFSDHPAITAMDLVGAEYWPQFEHRGHAMRKFCAFCGPYERFFFLDSDIVSLTSLAPYFEAFRKADVDFMWFSPDLNKVYHPGPVRDEMVSRYHTVAFNSGQFMGRRGALTPAMLGGLVATARPYRHGFVDILEQSFINFAIDVCNVPKAAGRELVPELAVAAAAMRLQNVDGHLVINDPRTPDSGRQVSLIHWSGYKTVPLMPYRKTWLKYRLASKSRGGRAAYRIASTVAAVGHTSWKTPVRLARRAIFRGRNVLASRGYIAWHR
jgi:hypothetical protein